MIQVTLRQKQRDPSMPRLLQSLSYRVGPRFIPKVRQHRKAI
jgi:hypothetical protein